MSQPGPDVNLSVDSAQITRHAADIKRIAGQIELQMKQMRTKLATLQGSWKGSASNEYATLHTQWERTQRTVKQNLDSIGLTLSRASTNYSTTEQAVRASFRTPS